MGTLSVCMIVKNEEKNLPGCLECIKDAVDEIIVVDTGSSDKTVEIARKFGARVYFFPWCDDFSAARNESLKHATGDYILYLDADDRMEKEDVEKLIALKKEFPQTKDKVYYFKLINTYEDKHQESCYQIRIFPNREELRFEGRVHERIGPAVRKLGLENVLTDIRLFHMGYNNQTKNRAKAERNLKLLLLDLQENPSYHVYYYLGQTYLYLGNTEKAKEFFRQAFVPEHRKEFLCAYITCGVQLANIALKEGKIEEGIRILERLHQEEPQNDVIKLFLGNFYLLGNRPEEALNILLVTNPNNLNLMFLPTSEEHYKANYYLKLGEAYQRLNYLKLAEGAYTEGLKYGSRNSQLWLNLGKLYLQTNKEEKAEECFKKALEIEINPQKKSQIYTLLGIINLQKNEKKEAERYFTEALNVLPSNIRALIHLAELKLAKGEIKPAQSLLETALGLSQNGLSLQIRAMLSFIYAQQGLLEQCVKMADQMLKDLKLSRNYVIKSIRDLTNIYANLSEYCKHGHLRKEAAFAAKTALLLSQLERRPNI